MMRADPLALGGLGDLHQGRSHSMLAEPLGRSRGDVEIPNCRNPVVGQHVAGHFLGQSLGEQRNYLTRDGPDWALPETTFQILPIG